MRMDEIRLYAWKHLAERELGKDAADFSREFNDSMALAMGWFASDVLTDEALQLIARFVWEYNRLGGDWLGVEYMTRRTLFQLIAFFNQDGWTWNGKLVYLLARQGWVRHGGGPLTLSLMTSPKLVKKGLQARDAYLEACQAKGV